MAPPTPPPLPPVPPSRQQKPSIYLAKLQSAPENWLSAPVESPAKPRPVLYGPSHYFFYGTLTQPEILKRILDLDVEPELRPARVLGYRLSSWGQYKALVNGKPGDEVFGYSFFVQSPEHEFKLARYETSAYELAPCQIYFTDEKEPRQSAGKTFMYAGDSRALKGGRFDPVLWEIQMGTSLRPKWRERWAQKQTHSEIEHS